MTIFNRGVRSRSLNRRLAARIGYLGQDGAEGVLFAFRTHLSEPIVLPPVRLAGLEPHTLYRVDGLNVPLSGAALMAVGITLELKDFSSVVRRFYRI